MLLSSDPVFQLDEGERGGREARAQVLNPAW